MRELIQPPPLGVVYYHADFDGVVAAAMLLRLNERPLDLVSVDYDQAPDWAERNLGDAAGVVDFLFHPDASFWVDHHHSTFQRPEWRDLAARGRHLIWDPEAPSCPAVLRDWLWFPRDHTQHFDTYTVWASKIDAAQYDSPAEATDLANPFLLLSHVIMQSPDQAALAHLVRLVAQAPVGDVLAEKRVRPLAERVRTQDARVRRLVRARMERHAQVGLLDQSELHVPYQRYLPYVDHPDLDYVVGVYRNGNDRLVVSVGENPWKAPGPLDIGALCATHGGGGHRRVGGIVVQTITQAQALVSDFIKVLNTSVSTRA